MSRLSGSFYVYKYERKLFISKHKIDLICISYARSNDRLFITTFIEIDTKTCRWSRSIIQSRKTNVWFLFSLNNFRKQFSNEQLIYLNNVIQCPAIHIILLYQLHQVIMKMIRVKIWFLWKYFFDLIHLLSAYYMSSLEGIREREWMPGNMLSLVMWSFFWRMWTIEEIMHERLVHYLRRILQKEKEGLRWILIDWFLLLGYSRNQTAPMSPRSYSAYTNAYGSSASYAVPSPGFLNG